jgi:hypothetical protein
MTTSAVVPDLEVGEGRVGELDAGEPALPVEELDQHAWPERLDHRAVIAVSDAAHRGHQPGILGPAGVGPVDQRIHPDRSPTDQVKPDAGTRQIGG